MISHEGMINIPIFAHLISRSSACSDNHREWGKVLERHKAAGTPAFIFMNENKQSKNIQTHEPCRVPKAELKIMTDLNFMNKNSNIM